MVMLILWTPYPLPFITGKDISLPFSFLILMAVTEADYVFYILLPSILSLSNTIYIFPFQVEGRCASNVLAA